MRAAAIIQKPASPAEVVTRVEQLRPHRVRYRWQWVAGTSRLQSHGASFTLGVTFPRLACCGGACPVCSS